MTVRVTCTSFVLSWTHGMKHEQTTMKHTYRKRQLPPLRTYPNNALSSDALVALSPPRHSSYVPQYEKNDANVRSKLCRRFDVLPTGAYEQSFAIIRSKTDCVPSLWFRCMSHDIFKCRKRCTRFDSFLPDSYEQSMPILQFLPFG